MKPQGVGDTLVENSFSKGFERERTLKSGVIGCNLLDDGICHPLELFLRIWVAL